MGPRFDSCILLRRTRSSVGRLFHSMPFASLLYRFPCLCAIVNIAYEFHIDLPAYTSANMLQNKSMGSGFGPPVDYTGSFIG